MSRLVTSLLLGLLIAGCSDAAPGTQQPAATDDSLQSAADDAEGSPTDPDWGERQLRLGQADLDAGDVTAAVAHFESVPRDGTEISIEAALSAGQLQESLGRLSSAIDSYEYVLEHQPQHHQVRARVAELYALSGQRAEADRHLSRLVSTPDLGFKPLVLLTDFERRHGEDRLRLEELEQRAPDDPAVQLGLAVEEIEDGQISSAQRRLEAVVAVDPELGAAQALLGEVLLLQSADEELARWHAALPESLQDHPAIWYTRGLWSLRLEEPAVAARCFWESARQCPTSYRAAYQLGQISTGLDPQVRESFAKRAEDLHALKENLSGVLDSGGRNEDAARNLVQLLLDSGREWEAWSWAVMLEPKHLTASWLRQSLAQLSSYPHTQSPRMLSSANLTVRHDLSHYPDFASLEPRLKTPAALTAGDTPPGGIRLIDIAEPLGLEFVYHRGHVAGLDGVRMQETTGGGVGVLDYDSDGRPDLFLTQGEDWPVDADQPAGSPAFRDAIFRNRGTHFENRTLAALPDEDGFGQGCTCGDFNSDGFPDMYVANIGANQLLLNNGDGTFTDHTPPAVSSLSAWTTSCAMADLNSDGHPDLFDVNYVEGPQLFRMICNENDCSPEAYQESRDDALISLGDGGLRQLAPETHGRFGGGLGIVVFRADEAEPRTTAVAATQPDVVSTTSNPLVPEPCLSVFVANDQDPNEYLKARAPLDAAAFTLVDEAFLAGLALDYNGETSACMGVAAGDLTGDGRLDLFVTNYSDEANSLFLQEANGLFHDGIGLSGLLQAGLPYIGWGTQCFDAENDGDLDLMVANGHVGEFSRHGLQIRMPTQVFCNTGAGRFREVPPAECGEFFQHLRMGRSLATLDWNRDGRTDLLLSPLDENIALLENQSPDSGNWLALRLIGTASARDAVGTVVTISTSGLTHRRQLTGGDGLQASNERLLRFGIQSHEVVERIVVEWPSGRVQEFTDLPANRQLLVREGLACLASPER